MFDGTTGALLAKFPVAQASYRGNVSISVGDVSGAGGNDLVVSYGQGQPWVSVYSGIDGSPLGSFLAYGKRAPGEASGSLSGISAAMARPTSPRSTRRACPR